MNDALVGSGEEELGAQLTSCLADNGYYAPHVSGLRRLTGGSTHDTWAFDLEYGDLEKGTADTHQNQPLILRRNLAHASLDMTPQAEFALLRWLHDEALPVARPLLCEPDGGALGMPFVIAERIIGTDLRKALAAEKAGAERAEIGGQLAGLQARVHALDISRCPDGTLAKGGPSQEVQRWTSPLLEPGKVASPLLRAAISWLEVNIPALDRPCIVHGDFKANNILWSEAGAPVILDWELAHIGDPVEDLAWTMLWTTRDDIVCGLLSPQDYLAAYERASGAVVDRERLFYWQLYALVKLCGILRSGSGTVQNESDLGPSHALLSRGSGYLEAAMADYLSAIAGKRAA